MRLRPLQAALRVRLVPDQLQAASSRGRPGHTGTEPSCPCSWTRGRSRWTRSPGARRGGGGGDRTGGSRGPWHLRACSRVVRRRARGRGDRARRHPGYQARTGEARRRVLRSRRSRRPQHGLSDVRGGRGDQDRRLLALAGGVAGSWRGAPPPGRRRRRDTAVLGRAAGGGGGHSAVRADRHMGRPTARIRPLLVVESAMGGGGRPRARPPAGGLRGAAGQGPERPDRGCVPARPGCAAALGPA